jgi:hypothetical protein
MEVIGSRNREVRPFETIIQDITIQTLLILDKSGQKAIG